VAAVALASPGTRRVVLTRSLSGAAAGLSAALVVPVRADGNTEAVLVLCARAEPLPAPEVVTTLEDMAIRMGQFLERERALAGLWRLEQAVEALDLGVTISDLGGRILYTNPAEAALHGYAPRELLGRHVSVFMPESWSPAPGRPGPNGSWRRETVNVHKDGTVFPVQLVSVPLRNRQGALIGTVTCCEEISERKRAQQRVEFQAYHDPLTELPNRVQLRDRMRLALAQARRAGRSVAVLFIDLDGFKAVNDRYGHAFGDRLLQEVAARLRECVREDDLVARVGGDEFVLLLPFLRQPDDAERIARKLAERVAEPLELDGRVLRVGTSVGIAFFPRDGDDEDRLLTSADESMYRAKERRKREA
jgi:diguanylate cyclase (GGDEF)-like protein/PAS domain S-box-containing protein